MNEAAFLTRTDQTGVGQRLEVKGERGRRHTKRLTNGPNGQPVRAGFHQQAPGGEASFLRQRSELFYDSFCFHISNYIEPFYKDKLLPLSLPAHYRR